MQVQGGVPKNTIRFASLRADQPRETTAQHNTRGRSSRQTKLHVASAMTNRRHYSVPKRRPCHQGRTPQPPHTLGRRHCEYATTRALRGGGANMEAAHSETRRLLVTARSQLEALEHATSRGLDPAASDAVLAAYRASLGQLAAATERLRSQAGRRAVWVARVSDLDDQLVELRAADERIVAAFRQIARDQLLVRAPSRGGDVKIAMGPVDEARSLESSSERASSILSTGSAALAALLDQRTRLKGARTRMLDVLHGLGVDRQLITRIVRREASDRKLLYACMAALLLILLAAVWLKSYLRRR